MRILIAGGGFAALEAMLAVRELAAPELCARLDAAGRAVGAGLAPGTPAAKVSARLLAPLLAAS